MPSHRLRLPVAGMILVFSATSIGVATSVARERGPEGDCGGGGRWPLADVRQAAPVAFADSPPPDIALRSLALHNAERERLGLLPFRWNCALAQDALDRALILERRGLLEHASAQERKGAGENLWMGTAGHYPVERMIGRFLDERAHYRHDRFPRVSQTGNWSDVGHYSQVVWRDTREIGCAVAYGTEQDVLVCRYRPAGNIIGRMPF